MLNELDQYTEKSLVRNQWMSFEQAIDEYLAYEEHYGQNHALLACHGVFPMILTSELINLIRINFLDDQQIPWIAEPDFLLSPFCRPIGDGFYHVDPNAREVLLVELLDKIPNGRGLLLRLSDFLLSYVVKLTEATTRSEFIRAYKWIAWSYLYPHRVVDDMTNLLMETGTEESHLPFGDFTTHHIQVATMIEVVREPLEYTLPLSAFRDLVETAEVLAHYWYQSKDVIEAPPENLRTSVEEGNEQTNTLLSNVINRIRHAEVEKDNQRLNALSKILKEKDKESRLTAVRTIGEIGSPSAVEALLTYLGDYDPDVRRAITEQLENIIDQSATESLLGKLQDHDPIVRQSALEVLAILGDRLSDNSIDKIASRLRDEDHEVRQSALETFGKVGDPSSIPYLAESLNDENASVRLKAVEVIGRIGDASKADVRDLLMSLLDDVEDAVRQASLASLADTLRSDSVVLAYVVNRIDRLDLSKLDLRGVNLSAARLRSARLYAADMKDAIIVDADLSGADLRAVRLENADLSGSNLQHANLQDALIRNADLSGADLRFANLENADLRGTKLTESILEDSSLIGADLSETDLTGANLMLEELLANTKLTGATMPDGTEFKEAAKTTEPEQAREKEPKSVQDYVQLGARYATLKDYENAIEAYNLALKLSPNSPQVLLNRSSIYRELSEYNMALADLDRTIKIDPDNSQAYLALGEVNFTLALYDHARENIHQAIKIAPDNSQAYLALGRVNFTLALYDDARENINQAIKIDPNNYQAYLALGEMDLTLERYEEARENIHRAIKIDPNNSQAYLALGEMDLTLERYEEARENIHQAIKINPNNSQAYLALGEMDLTLERYEEARENIHQAIKIDPNNSQAHLALGEMDLTLERYEEARENIHQAIKIDPNNSQAYLALGEMDLTLERYEEARENIHQAIKIDPNNSQAYLALGEMDLTLERYEEALDYFKHALELHPNNDFAQYNLGCAYHALRRYEDAFNAIKRAFELNPRPTKERISFLSELIPYLEEPKREKAIQDILTTFETIPERQIKEEISGEIVRSLAKAGDSEQVLKVAQTIEEKKFRAETLSDAAQALAQRGMVEESFKVAKTIQVEEVRTKVLSELPDYRTEVTGKRITMPKIFICYRREDSSYPTQQLYRYLSDYFGSESIVIDVCTIPLGTNFREYLNNEVSQCDILLAVIGDQWIDILKQRFDDPTDFVRIEIQAALEREIPVVPILVGKASVPSEKSLPPELAGLAYRNAAEVRAGPDLQTHLKRLIGGLDRLLAERKAEGGLKQKGTMDSYRFEELGKISPEPQKRFSGSDIYICYARVDRVKVRPLAKSLEKKGWSIWWDPKIRPGDSFDRIIEEALEETRSIIVVWSKNSVNSNWVSAEAEEGLRRNILIPVLIEDVKIPLRFRSIQSAMLFDWRGESNHPGFEQIIMALNSILGPPETMLKRSPEPEKQSPGSDIFISYASQDRSRAEPLANALEEQGWSVWWDRTIPAGKVFYKVIEEALDSTKCVIAIWSKNSVNSNWVSAEAEEGLRRNILIPVLIEDVKIPLRFRSIQSTMLFDWRGESNHPGFEQIIMALNSILGPPATLHKRSPEPKNQTPGSDIFKSYASKDRFKKVKPTQSISHPLDEDLVKIHSPPVKTRSPLTRIMKKILDIGKKRR